MASLVSKMRQKTRSRKIFGQSSESQESPRLSQSLQQPPGFASPPVNAVYYPNWAVYRPLLPSALDLSCITHILYAFMWPNADGTLESSDAYADYEKEVDGVQGGLAALAQLRAAAPRIKILLSVGGGGRGSSNFAAAAATQASQARLVSSLLDVVTRFSFDGIDIDWEHPQSHEDRAHYVSLLRGLRETLPTSKYILTAAIPCPSSALQYLPLTEMAKELDLIFLMAYDFTGPWTELSGHHAQLHGPPLSGSSTVAHLRSGGIPTEKIVLGIPVYGRHFPGARTIDERYQKPRSEEEGTVEYNLLPPADSTEWLDKERIAAGCAGPGGFTSYDSTTTVAIKARWAQQQQLAGLFYWTILGDRRGSLSLIQTGWNALQDQI